MAILLATCHTDLHAVTTVAGNAPLPATTTNALAALQVFDVEVPVHAGADRPLLRPPRHAPEVHGESGLSGVTLPSLRSPARPEPAVMRILSESRAVPGLWIVATGPLTNVALALRADPGLAARLGGVAVMGGGVEFGNVTPAAEFNFWADPEAAHIVLSAGVEVLVCGLDVTHQVLVDAAFAERLRVFGTTRATFMADVVTGFLAGYEGVFPGRHAAPVHDACAVLACTHPDLFEFHDLHVTVDTGHGAAAGSLIADRRSGRRRLPPNARVAMTADADAILELIGSATAAGGT